MVSVIAEGKNVCEVRNTHFEDKSVLTLCRNSTRMRLYREGRRSRTPRAPLAGHHRVLAPVPALVLLKRRQLRHTSVARNRLFHDTDKLSKSKNDDEWSSWNVHVCAWMAQTDEYKSKMMMNGVRGTYTSVLRLMNTRVKMMMNGVRGTYTSVLGWHTAIRCSEVASSTTS